MPTHEPPKEEKLEWLGYWLGRAILHAVMWVLLLVSAPFIIVKTLYLRLKFGPLERQMTPDEKMARFYKDGKIRYVGESGIVPAFPTNEELDAMPTEDEWLRILRERDADISEARTEGKWLRTTLVRDAETPEAEKEIDPW